MAKTVFIGVGHGGSDPGACANSLIERDVNLIMAVTCYNVLTKHGVNAILSRWNNTESDTIYEEVQEENAARPDVAFEIHNNAGGGDGSEFYYYSGDPNGKRLAELCKKHTEAIGQNNRKVVARDQFIWINSTVATAVLCEGFFLDNAADKQIADTVAEQEKFGEAYAKAILEYLGIAYKEPSGNSGGSNSGSSGDLMRVQVGAFRGRKNAENLVKELKAKGYNAIIK